MTAMTAITEHTTIAEKARAGRRAALTSLHSRLGHTEKVISIFDNAFPIRAAEPEFRTTRTTPLRRPVLATAGLAAA